jgi:Ca2+-binding RTX toxin-like protein
MVGKVTTEGDRAMRSKIARQRFNVDGTGITIGVISDSFNAYGEAELDVLDGDLPGQRNPNGDRQPVRVLSDVSDFRFVSDEGRAMLQIIHDVAPGAKLLFHASGENETQFAQSIQALTQAGADIIVDDIGFPSSATFQDGVAAQAANRAVDQGIVYFAAAGNDSDRAYESPFRPGATFTYRGSTYEAQDFDAGAGVDVFQNIRLPKNRDRSTALSLIFSWDQPIGQVANDMEIFLLENPQLPGAGGKGVENAIVTQYGFDTPAKQLNYSSRSAQTVYLVIARRVDPGAPTPGLVKWSSFANGADSNIQFEYVNEGGARGSSTIFGQPNAKGAIAVGAVNVDQTPAFGVAVPQLATFSSQGKTPILFDQRGDRLAEPEVRQKPEITAPSGVSTTVDNPFTRGIDFSPFSGTSAAAPHAAAVAALILQRAGGRKSLTPTQVLATLQNTGIAPSGDAGGFIQADAAVMGAAMVERIGTTGNDRLRGTKAADNLWGGSGDDRLNGADGFDVLMGEGGHDRLEGRAGNDYLVGGKGQDWLLGGLGADTLVGNQGQDTLQGGKGNNLLIGGKGRDRFVLSWGGVAQIKDFDINQDRIALPKGLGISAIEISPQRSSVLIEASGQLLAKLNGVSTLSTNVFLR